MSSSKSTYGQTATRARILDQAWRLMGEAGDVTLQEVAKAAGVSRQSVYLHFTDRTGLLVALVRHMDDELGLGTDLEKVFAASTGAEAMARAVVVHSTFNPGIDAVARYLEAEADPSSPLAVAWRERMNGRLDVHREIMRRLDADGDLATGWTVERAAAFMHAATLPSTWRELTTHQGWTAEAYVADMTAVLRAAFVRH